MTSSLRLVARRVSSPIPKLHRDLSFDPVSFKKTKHTLRAAEDLRDDAARVVFLLVFVAGKSNVADIRT